MGLELKRAETQEKGSLIGADSEIEIHINPSCLFSSTFVGGGINKCLPNHTGGERVENDDFPPYSGRKNVAASANHTVDVKFMKKTRPAVCVCLDCLPKNPEEEPGSKGTTQTVFWCV